MALTHRAPLARAAALALAGTLHAGCERAAAVPRALADGPAAVQVAAADGAVAMRADTATIELPRAYPGQVYVEHDVAVAARSAGALERVLVELGAPVRAGQPLAAVERRAQEIATSAARERLDRARLAAARTRSLAAGGRVADAELEAVAGEMRQAELAVERAEHELALTRVTAPFAGVVTARYARARQLVAPGDTLFRVAATSPQLVRVRVAEPSARQVGRGDAALVRAAAGGAAARATVLLASPAIEPASGTREVIVRVTGAPFLVGESVVVELGSERRLAVVVPRAAVAPEGWVLVADGGRTTVRPVTLGADAGGGRVEVASGLAAGERLVPPRP